MEMTIREMFEYENSKKLVLPDFQRNFEWNTEKQKQFLAAFLVKVPIGSLLILDGTRDDFAARSLCFSNLSVTTKEECLYLLDGQQRLSCLKNAFYDYFAINDEIKWTTVLQDIDSKLAYRWFVRVKPEPGEEDVFGWQKLNSQIDLLNYEPSQLAEYIVSKKIYKTKPNEWFHPGYTEKDDTGEFLGENELKNKVASRAANEGFVSLYSVFTKKIGEYPLHRYTLERIAEQRAGELKAAVKDGSKDIVDLLKLVEPEIAKFVRIKDEEKILNAWSKLQTKWSSTMDDYLTNLLNMEIPVFKLPTREMSRAVAIFENLNRGGTPLSTFDLVVARAARDRGQESLSSRILKLLITPIALPNVLVEGVKDEKPKQFNPALMDIVDGNTIADKFKEQYLNLLSMLSGAEYGHVEDLSVDSIKKNTILNLPHDKINKNTSVSVTSLLRAAAFLHIRCGIVKLSNLPYALMILPMAYVLKEDEVWNNKSKLDKIEYWYWTSLFGGIYRERQNSNCIDDCKKLYMLIHENIDDFELRIERMLNVQDYSDLDVLLRKDPEQPVPTAIHDGLLQYVLSNQPFDFYPSKIRLNTWDIAEVKYVLVDGKNIKIDTQDHHIVPLSNMAKISESTSKLRTDKTHILNSPLNRTYITSSANNSISTKTPQQYLQELNSMTLWGHCLPSISEYDKQSTETDYDQKYYERVLKKRYEEFKKCIGLEIDQLRNS